MIDYEELRNSMDREAREHDLYIKETVYRIARIALLSFLIGILCFQWYYFKAKMSFIDYLKHKEGFIEWRKDMLRRGF